MDHCCFVAVVAPTATDVLVRWYLHCIILRFIVDSKYVCDAKYTFQIVSHFEHVVAGKAADVQQLVLERLPKIPKKKPAAVAQGKYQTGFNCILTSGLVLAAEFDQHIFLSVPATNMLHVFGPSAKKKARDCGRAVTVKRHVVEKPEDIVRGAAAVLKELQGNHRRSASTQPKRTTSEQTKGTHNICMYISNICVQRNARN